MHNHFHIHTAGKCFSVGEHGRNTSTAQPKNNIQEIVASLGGTSQAPETHETDTKNQQVTDC